ncbi:MAG: hypothetical protein KIT33_01395 [Candidatus Kapabacteria bacterium]|nr:hypothetical protein [Ignavibacteriota bacterium]MCW5883604.1 hypothetical protein [Candidatus Kapabacteria bacterium]
MEAIKGKIVENQKEVFLSFRVNLEDREKFKFLAKAKNKSASELITEIINDEFSKELKPSEIRKLSPDMQEFYWNQQIVFAEKVLKSNKELTDLPQLDDGIE